MDMSNLRKLLGLGSRRDLRCTMFSVRYSGMAKRAGHERITHMISQGQENADNQRSILKVVETNRLILRKLSTEDADFILELVNEPSWLRFIGDKGVRSIADARDYILKGPVESYERFGFGLYLAELKENGIPIGLCGLIKRESLKDVDIGFAFLPKFWGKGYAYESASAVMAYGKSALGVNRIVAVTTPDNHNSIKVLEKLGFKFEQMVMLSVEAPEIKLFAHDESVEQQKGRQ
jgi:RimJ/RimL family protein N-acetyltransferase